MSGESQEGARPSGAELTVGKPKTNLPTAARPVRPAVHIPTGIKPPTAPLPSVDDLVENILANHQAEQNTAALKTDIEEAIKPHKDGLLEATHTRALRGQYERVGGGPKEYPKLKGAYLLFSDLRSRINDWRRHAELSKKNPALEKYLEALLYSNDQFESPAKYNSEWPHTQQEPLGQTEYGYSVYFGLRHPRIVNKLLNKPGVSTQVLPQVALMTVRDASWPPVNRGDDPETAHYPLMLRADFAGQDIQLLQLFFNGTTFKYLLDRLPPDSTLRQFLENHNLSPITDAVQSYFYEKQGRSRWGSSADYVGNLVIDLRQKPSLLFYSSSPYTSDIQFRYSYNEATDTFERQYFDEKEGPRAERHSLEWFASVNKELSPEIKQRIEKNEFLEMLDEVLSLAEPPLPTSPEIDE